MSTPTLKKVFLDQRGTTSERDLWGLKKFRKR
jgi:hypothetical protein